MSKLLEGVRVLEFAVLLNGDSVGMRLADMGADVIKVEAPPLGDYLRDINGTLAPRHSVHHLQANKSKRSIALNLKSDNGRAALWKLLATADIVIDGFLAGAMDRLGVGYEAVRAHKPDIIFCHYSGFGSRGPYARIPTHGQMMDALASAFTMYMGDDGLMYREMDDPGGAANGGEGTAAGAMYAALHAVAALNHRARTGQGAFIDVSAADAVVMQSWTGSSIKLNRHRITDAVDPPKTIKGVMPSVKYQFYETADKKVVLFCAIEHKFWDAFCDTVGRPDLKDYKDTRTPIDFGWDEGKRRELQAIFSTRTQAEWLELALSDRLPIGAAPRTLDEMRADPHMAVREVVIEGEHPIAGAFTYLGAGALVEGQPLEIRPAPEFGQHTVEILTELGYSQADIDAITGGR